MTFDKYIEILAYLYKLPILTIINKIATSNSLEEYISKLDEECDKRLMKENLIFFECSIE